MKRLLSQILLLLCITSAASAQTQIDRQMALDSALSANPAYLAAKEDNMSALYSYRATWGEFLPTLSLSYSARNTEAANFSATSSTVLSAGLNVFRGFRSYAAMRSASYQAERYSQTEWQTMTALVRDVNIAYQAALRADYLRTTSKTLFDSAELLLKEAETRQRLDIITRADLYKARADREKAYASVLDAEVNYQESLLTLAQLTGLDMGSEVTLLPEERTYSLYELDSYLDAAEMNNSALRISGLNVDIAKQKHRSSWGAMLPSVDLSAGTGWYEDMADYNSHYVGITATWSLFEGMSDTFTALSNARALSSARLNLVSERMEVTKQVRLAWMRAKTSNEKVLSAEAYLQAAEESYIATQEMFRLGRATLKETVDERATLEDAQASLADAKYIMVQAYEELIFLTGGKVE